MAPPIQPIIRVRIGRGSTRDGIAVRINEVTLARLRLLALVASVEGGAPIDESAMVERLIAEAAAARSGAIRQITAGEGDHGDQ